MFYILNPDHSTTKVDDPRLWRATPREKCRVGNTENDKFFISTVFLGIDHNLGHTEGHNRPVLFETMVFNIKDGEVDYSEIDMQRYCTWAEAEEGHQAMCAKYIPTTI